MMKNAKFTTQEKQCQECRFVKKRYIDRKFESHVVTRVAVLLQAWLNVFLS